jgi:lipopolysaccharide biosynthesis glycosyltransferase
MTSSTGTLRATVALSFDSRYVLPACVLLHSLGCHWEGTGELPVCCLVDHTVTTGDQARLAAVAERAGIALTVRRMQKPPREASLPHLSPMAWAKLDVPTALAPDYDVVLYLDSDMVARTSVHPLLRRPAGGMVLGAVRDYFLLDLGNPFYLPAPGFGLAPGEETLPYFNSGLMLIDTREWTRQRIPAKVAELLATKTGADTLLFDDQDVLNTTLRGGFELLDPRWNFQPMRETHAAHDFEYRENAYFPESYRRSLERNPWIVHYVTDVKPWDASFPDTRIRSIWRAAAGDVQEVLDGLRIRRAPAACPAGGDSAMEQDWRPWAARARCA